MKPQIIYLPEPIADEIAWLLEEAPSCGLSCEGGHHDDCENINIFEDTILGIINDLKAWRCEEDWFIKKLTELSQDVCENKGEIVRFLDSITYRLNKE